MIGRGAVQRVWLHYVVGCDQIFARGWLQYERNDDGKQLPPHEGYSTIALMRFCGACVEAALVSNQTLSYNCWPYEELKVNQFRTRKRLILRGDMLTT